MYIPASSSYDLSIASGAIDFIFFQIRDTPVYKCHYYLFAATEHCAWFRSIIC